MDDIDILKCEGSRLFFNQVSSLYIHRLGRGEEFSTLLLMAKKKNKTVDKKKENIAYVKRTFILLKMTKRKKKE